MKPRRALRVLGVPRALRRLRVLGVLAALGAVLVARPAFAQCVGAAATEDFAPTMKGCAGAVAFASRGSMCAAGWHVCSAQEWVDRYGGKTPAYVYWTNDALHYSTDGDGCVARLTGGNECTDAPMRVCSVSRAEFDGAYGTAARVYTLQTFGPDGTAALATSLDRSTLAADTLLGAVSVTGSALQFSGTRLGAPGGLTLTFTSDTTGTDGSAPFSRLATQEYVPTQNDFAFTTDPLGNGCNWHTCGLNTGLPNRYFGGCNGNLTAGTLCCQ